MKGKIAHIVVKKRGCKIQTAILEFYSLFYVSLTS